MNIIFGTIHQQFETFFHKLYVVEEVDEKKLIKIFYVLN